MAFNLKSRPLYVVILAYLIGGIYGFVWGGLLVGESSALIISLFVGLVVGGFIQFCSDNVYHYLTMTQTVRLVSSLSLQRLTRRLDKLFTEIHDESWYAQTFTPSHRTRYRGKLNNNHLMMNIAKGHGKRRTLLEVNGILHSTSPCITLDLKVTYPIITRLVAFLFLIHPVGLILFFISVVVIQNRMSSVMHELSKALNGKIVDTKKLGQGN